MCTRWRSAVCASDRSDWAWVQVALGWMPGGLLGFGLVPGWLLMHQVALGGLLGFGLVLVWALGGLLGLVAGFG